MAFRLMRNLFIVLLVFSLNQAVTADAKLCDENLALRSRLRTALDNYFAQFKAEQAFTLIPGDFVSYKLRFSGLPSYRFLDITMLLSDGGQVPLVSVLPEFVKNNNNQLAPKGSGANCWGAIKAYFDPTYGAKFLSFSEAEEFLKKDFEIIKPGELIKKGDVLAIYDGFVLRHTVIYLDKDYVWHKPSSGDDTPYTFESLESVVNFWLEHQKISINIKALRKKP